MLGLGLAISLAGVQMRSFLCVLLTFSLAIHPMHAHAKNALTYDYTKITPAEADELDASYAVEDNWRLYNLSTGWSAVSDDAEEAKQMIETHLNSKKIFNLKLSNVVHDLFIRHTAMAKLAVNGFFNASAKEEARFLRDVSIILKAFQGNSEIQTILEILLSKSNEYMQKNIGLLSPGQKQRLRTNLLQLKQNLSDEQTFEKTVYPLYDNDYPIRKSATFMFSYVAIAILYNYYTFNELVDLMNMMNVPAMGLPAQIMALSTYLINLLAIPGAALYVARKYIFQGVVQTTKYTFNNAPIRKLLTRCHGLLTQGAKK